MILCVLWYCSIFFRQILPPDVGDGIMHFFISQASWENKTLFLHHWGKPLYILLSSPFSQFGYNGMFVFQIFVFTFTCIFAFKIFKRWKIPVVYSCFFVLFLTLTKDYSETILSGLTEPLFNLFLICIAYLLQQKKFLLFAIFISFTPFLRSEGQLVVLVGFFVLLFLKQFRVIPFLVLGFLLYSTIGFFVYEDFWWYFTKSAYTYENDIYGYGKWNHYLLSYKNYLGNHGLFLFIGVVVLFFVKKNWKLIFKELWILIFISFTFFIGNLFAHSYFWACGKNGSMGLTRIATQGMPLFVLVLIVLFHLFTSHLNVFSHLKRRKIISYFFVFIAIYNVFLNKKFPIPITPFDQSIIKSVKYLKSQKFSNKILYHHPLYPFLFGVNPLMKQHIFYPFPNIFVNNKLNPEIKEGDLLIYDTHFSAIEAKLNLDAIRKIEGLTCVNTFLNTNGNNPFGIYLFQKQNTKIYEKKRIKKVLDNTNVHVNQEFHNILKIYPENKEKDMIISLQAKHSSSIFLVCSDKQVLNYQAISIQMDSSFYFHLHEDKIYDLYLWNPNKEKIDVKIMKIELIETKYPELISNY